MNDICSLHKRPFMLGCIDCKKCACSKCLIDGISYCINISHHRRMEYEEYKEEIKKTLNLNPEKEIIEKFSIGLPTDLRMPKEFQKQNDCNFRVIYNQLKTNINNSYSEIKMSYLKASQTFRSFLAQTLNIIKLNRLTRRSLQKAEEGRSIEEIMKCKSLVDILEKSELLKKELDFKQLDLMNPIIINLENIENINTSIGKSEDPEKLFIKLIVEKYFLFTRQFTDSFQSEKFKKAILGKIILTPQIESNFNKIKNSDQHSMYSREKIQLFLFINISQLEIVDFEIELKKIHQVRIEEFTIILETLFKSLTQKHALKSHVFNKSLFQSKSRKFESYRTNSTFLFYLELGSPMNLHLKNLLNESTFKIPFYNTSSYNDAEQLFNQIYVCAGDSGNEKTCMVLDLSNLNNPQLRKIQDLVDNHGHHSTLVTTIQNLYIIGGDNSQCSCEFYDSKLNQWNKVSNLNAKSCSHTVTFIQPSFIYCLGNHSQNGFERLDIQKVENKWETLIVLNATPRRYGCSFQISDDTILLFGGPNSPTKFVNFNWKNNTVTETKYPFNNYLYYSSKVRLFSGKLIVVSSESKKLIKIELKSLNVEEEDIKF